MPAISSPTRRVAPESLRSHRWLGVDTLRGFGHRSRLAQSGFGREDYAGKPVIAVLNTWSGLNPCHGHLRERAADVMRGVWQAGGFPVELPVLSLSENFQKPTTMLYRNLLAMEAEEILRSHPIDGCVLLGGCDKTTPGLLMAAISANLPAIFVPAGPMIPGLWRGERLGSGSDAWKYWAERRAENLSEAEWQEIEEGIARSPGTCMTMGTAATMMSLAEAMGFSLPGSSAIPAVDAAHPRMAAASGRRCVEMVWEDLRPRAMLDEASFDNAIVTLLALGGSTNAVIHLLALAGRAGIPLSLDRFDALSRKTPWLANLRPAGEFLMADFFRAGGLPALLGALGDHLQLSARTVTGRSLGDNIAGAGIIDPAVIRGCDAPLAASDGLAILRGNLAPDGAVIKPPAAEPRLRKHSGRAVVFDSYEEMEARMDDPALDVDADSVLVLRNAGPRGGPGMPEWGQLPIPQKLLRQGVRDMLRISDARMSGTSYGACVLHVAPEAAIGGPLALVHEGDRIELDVARRLLQLHVHDEELARRRSAWKPPPEHYPRGYGWLFMRHIQQANVGCDFDFLTGTAPLAEPAIH